MKTIFHKASERGSANHGWLNAKHSFSFANYYNPQKIHFGKLRVLNDDIVQASKGFGLHPHEDMEIITIPLSGALKHTDNMGHEEVISTGEVQVMSAGTGVWHSEFNASDKEPINLFQIWIFTDKKGHQPRYDQKLFSEKKRINNWQLLVSPNGKNESLWIHQNAFISVIDAQNIESINYPLNDPNNGVYFMLIEGETQILNHKLEKRDALGISEIDGSIGISFLNDSKLLAIEVPMK